jgi:hypothetical protein
VLGKLVAGGGFEPHLCIDNTEVIDSTMGIVGAMGAIGAIGDLTVHMQYTDFSFSRGHRGPPRLAELNRNHLLVRQAAQDALHYRAGEAPNSARHDYAGLSFAKRLMIVRRDMPSSAATSSTVKSCFVASMWPPASSMPLNFYRYPVFVRR